MPEWPPQSVTTTAASKDAETLSERIVGRWELADGRDYVIEFTETGLMSVRNKAGEEQVVGVGRTNHFFDRDDRVDQQVVDRQLAVFLIT